MNLTPAKILSVKLITTDPINAYCVVHAVGVAVDVAWQRTCTQQSLMQQWENCFSYGVCSEATIADATVGVFFVVRSRAI
jgi:hypothetical protein